jgi:hypothetical protein
MVRTILAWLMSDDTSQQPADNRDALLLVGKGARSKDMAEELAILFVTADGAGDIRTALI